MAIEGINSNNFNFGSYSSIKKQAEEVAKRVEAESKERKAQQKATGLLKNAYGDTVEISSIPEWEREVLEQREQNNSVSPREAILAALATAPNTEDVEKSIERADKFIAIRNKMQSGQRLTGEEKSFLQAYYPELASTAESMEQEVQQLKISLRDSKSKEHAQQIYMDTKTRLMSGINKNDSYMLFLIPAIDKAYTEFA